MKSILNQKEEYSPALLQYEIKTVLKADQQKLAKRLKVSTAAISRAIKNDPALKALRDKIIQKIQNRKKAA